MEPPKLWSAGAPPTCGRGVADPYKYALPRVNTRGRAYL